MSSLLRLEPGWIRAQTKEFFKCISSSHISISLYSFGIETITTFIHSRGSLENHTRFQTKTAQKPYPMGQHILL